eukprot:424486-Pyramimonas_sp.AAC.1
MCPKIARAPFWIHPYRMLNRSSGSIRSIASRWTRWQDKKCDRLPFEMPEAQEYDQMPHDA